MGTPARRVHGSIEDVAHVVILMQENRAFDHYFGCLRGVRGFGDPRMLTLPSGKSVLHQPCRREGGESVLPFRLNSATTSAECMGSLDHGWKGRHELWRNHDAWVATKGPMTMGYFTREDIPFYYALADAFTICDAYHCSVFGPTNPNRLHLFTGTSGLSVEKFGPHAVNNADDGNETADAARDDQTFDAFGWTTYAERLQDAGVSWKVYQEYDNFGDNPLALFANFRGLDPASTLHERARDWVEGSTPENAQHSCGEHLIAAFARDVQADALPQVSWIIAPTKGSEHPDASPAQGEAFTAQMIEALAANPTVFAKSVFLLTYDENDGFFDHVPPPIPATDPELGASTVATTGEVYGATPVGLGPRVPMIVVSPWSRGGWVNSELFDHTSVLRFLEARFGVSEPNISPWRRAVTGDLTSAFDFSLGRPGSPFLPAVDSVSARVHAACRLAHPSLPGEQAPPVQEPGVRPARPLPYVLEVSGALTPNGLELSFDNQGSAGACFSVHAPGGVAGPWFYTVEAGRKITAAPAYLAPAIHELTVYGPNGFYRQFRDSPSAASGLVLVRYEPEADRIVLRLQNDADAPWELLIRPNAYDAAPPRRRRLAPGETIEEPWPVKASRGWYDLSVTAPGGATTFLRRVAGRMENGRPGVSDPAMSSLPPAQAATLSGIGVAAQA